MIGHFVLTAVQSRILLSLFFDGALGSNSILKKVGISGTSWSKEKRFLIDCGLVNSVAKREMTEKGVLRRTEFTLTARGKLVTQNLLAISYSLSSSGNEPESNKLKELATTMPK